MPVTLRRQKKKEKEKEKTTIADHGPLEHAIQDPRVSRLCTDDVCVTVAVNLLPAHLLEMAGRRRGPRRFAASLVGAQDEAARMRRRNDGLIDHG